MTGLPIISLSEAAAKGLRRYFTGRPCPRGHISERFVSSHGCIACMAERQVEERAKRPQAVAARNAKYRERYKEARQRATREWRNASHDHLLQYGKTYRAKNKAERNAKARADYYANRERRIEVSVEWVRNHLRTDAQFKLKHNLRARIRVALRRRQKGGSAIHALGAAIDVVVRHIERMFAPGMNWENWGKKWHLDHIRPLSSFDLSDPAQFSEAANYLNLRPIWKQENLKKGATRELLL